MRLVTPDPSWPESWSSSFVYDQMEVFGAAADPAYARRYRDRHARAIQGITEHVSPPARVLDVAAAQGNFSIALAELGFDVTWNDLRADLADYVELKRDRGTIHYKPGNVFDLAVSGFDAVLMTEVIEHVAHPDQFLAHIATMVKPGGVVVLTTPNGDFVRNDLPRFSDCPDPSVFESEQFKPNADGHIFLLYEDEVRRFAAEAGLAVESLSFFTNVLTAGFLKTATMGKRAPRLVAAAERRTSTWRGRVGRGINTQILAVLRRPMSA